MDKTIYVALISIIPAALFSFLFFYNDRSQYAIIGYGIYGTAQFLVQLFVGAVLKSQRPKLGKGLMLGAGLIFLIGFGICTSGRV